MGYAPAAARRALEATGSVEAAISALDPGYCAAVDTQQARGNANHLLRFTTERPQQQPPPRRRAPAKPRSAHRPRGIAFEAPAIRLLVAAGVASPFACDADEAPPWESVVAADVVRDAIRCPICLEDEARAPVVTRCGHGFCAACVVRHCTSDYVRSRKCPCCAAPLGVRDLRPAFLRKPAADLVLLERPKSGRRACLADRVAGRLPSSNDRCDLLAKITEATPAAVQAAQRDFRAALADASVKADDEAERRAVAAAAAYLDVEPVSSNEPSMEEPTEEAKTYRFYGRRDGALVFLHPLPLKLLIAAVGGIENLPEALPELRVAHAERFEQSPATRKRFPWLAHVPIGCDVTLLDARGDGGFGSEFTERCRRAREGDPALRDALAARAKTVRREQERSNRAERRHTHNVEKRLAEKAPPRAAPYIQQEGDFAPVEPEITEELQARAEAALGAAPTAMSFANTVARNFAAPEGAFPELSASPPAAPVAAAPASSWGGRAVTRGDQLDRARFAAPPRASLPPRAAPPPATTWGGRGAEVAAAPPPKSSPKRKPVKKTLSLTGGGRRY
jgi:hypothetical protein